MRVLLATSEMTPLIKTGGLADVSGALPLALQGMGIETTVLLPGYPQVLKALSGLQRVAEFPALNSIPAAHLLAGHLRGGVQVWIIDCPELYQRGGGPYQDGHGHDWPDNAYRFGLLSRIAAILGSAASPMQWKPDVVHCNDWQAGLTPAYLHFANNPAPSVMSIHNLAFQGVFPASVTAKLGLPESCFQIEGVEYYGSLSFLKAGVYYADMITTVSPSYAMEIQTPELGFGMHGLLAHRRNELSGILNGVDYAEWNPAADPHLVRAYDASHLKGKAVNKAALQKRMGLHQDPAIPLFGLVSRFTNQKGVDLVLGIAAHLVSLPAQLVLLGSGDETMQQAARILSQRHAGQIAAQIGFDEGLSHLIEAGADIFLMPSRFEPCGLNQMYSQRYGTPPVVHATGGLKDTVVDCSEQTLASGEASGFVFDDMDAPGLLAAVFRAASVFHNKKTFRSLQLNGMNRDFSWDKSAAAYRDLDGRLVRG
ncbi:MAG: glycogen synthase GlgA [Gallionellaceae bacterium]